MSDDVNPPKADIPEMHLTAANPAAVSDGKREPFPLTRDTIRSGLFARMMAEARGNVRRLSDAERKASLDDMLSRRPEGDLWVFGYGSLIWNPAINFAEQRVGVLRGYMRRFCLWTELGRGSPECPGLVLGLEPGGCCRGVVYRITESEVRMELEILWQREMAGGAYVPRWLPVTVRSGRERRTFPALAFTVNPAHERYAGRLSDEQVADSIAWAGGPLGSCADYLFNTVERLGHLGIHDGQLVRLRDMVALRRSTGSPSVVWPPAG